MIRAFIALGVAVVFGQPCFARAQAASTLRQELRLLRACPEFVAGQAYPNKPVRVIVAFAAGGFADSVARQIGQKLSDRLGQPFVIDNRGGAGGNIAAKIAAEATPDGYTLLVHTAASSINPTLYKNLGFDLLKDLAPVANTVSAAGLFAVLASHPARNLQDLIRMSKGKRLNYATAGVGTSSHIAADYLLRVLARLDAVHVPFKGGGPAVVAVLGNQVELLSGSGSALAVHQAGKDEGAGGIQLEAHWRPCRMCRRWPRPGSPDSRNARGWVSLPRQDARRHRYPAQPGNQPGAGAPGRRGEFHRAGHGPAPGLACRFRPLCSGGSRGCGRR